MDDKMRMTEYQTLLAIQNGFAYVRPGVWVRLSDPTLYDDGDVLRWLAARRLLEEVSDGQD